MRQLFTCLLLLLIIKVGAQEEKKIIGFAPFEGQYNSSILNSIEEVIASSLVKTKRFNIVGRSQMAALKNERELQKSEDFMDGKYIAQSKSLGAQYLLSGNVSSVTTDTSQSKMSDGSYSTIYNAAITVDIKVLDVETGQIVASEVITSKADKGLLDLKSWGNMVTGKSASNEQEAYSIALTRLGKEVDKFVGKYFPVSFVIVEIQSQGGDGSAKTVLINGGSAFGLEKGERLKVVELVDMDVAGKKVTRKKEIGELKISKVEDENFSICEVKSGGIDINAKFKSQAKLQTITIK